MKNLGLTVILSAGMVLTGCLQDNGTKEIPANLNNSDFAVVTEPSTGGSTTTGEGGGDSAPSVPAPVPGETLNGFDINRGEVLTSSASLRLDFYPPFHTAVTKISENSTCSGGVWTPYVDSDSYVSAKVNQTVPLSVQFRDPDGRLSRCYAKSIVIDQVGPEIVFAKYPSATVEEGSDVEIIFSVVDPGAGVSEVTCQMGSVSKACGVGTNKLVLPQLAGGDYTIKVSAKDNLGFTSEKSVTFSVSSAYRKMVHSAKVNEYNKVDILFVIDNSGSMEYEQKSMASRVSNFLNVVQGLDWQIAVTTTDPRSEIDLGDGKLIPLYNKTNSYVLTPSTSNASQTLSMTLQRPEVGSGYEQGIRTAYRAVERSLASAGTNKNFIRSDAQLAVVLISDEDESESNLINDPANFVKFIQTKFNNQKSMSFHSIIARPDDAACLSGEGYSAGHRYAALSNLTGGVIGDVCAADYSAQVQGIAEGVRKTLKSLTLACAPVVDSVRSITVVKDGQVYNGTRKMEGLNLVFDDMLPAGDYEVYYSCLK